MLPKRSMRGAKDRCSDSCDLPFPPCLVRGFIGTGSVGREQQINRKLQRRSQGDLYEGGSWSCESPRHRQATFDDREA